MTAKISTIDLAIILIYLGGILFVGIFFGLRGRKKDSSEGFFLAGRSLNWLMIGAALFAANISTIHMVGLVAQGFKDGLVWGNFEWMATFLLIILGLIFAPFYFRTKISTLPEYLERRYGPYARSFLAFIALMSALFGHIGVSLYAGAIVFENFFGIDLITSILVISGVTLIYTILGGLKAVVVTETIQTVILVIGAVIMTVLSIHALGDHGIHSMAELKNALRPQQLSVIHTNASSPLPVWAVLLGYPVLGLYYWCADQTIVQKVLGAKSLNDAKKGPIFAGFIKILPVFMMVLPGALAYALFGDKITDPNDTLPILINELMPVGLKGILAATLMAALMSTIAAGLNSSGTLVSIDIVKRLFPKIPDKRILRIGRITILSVMIASVLWSPFIGQFKSIFEAVNSLLAVLSPPVSAVLILGVFWKRGNNTGALVSMITGFILGVIVFILDFAPISGSMHITDGLKIPFMMQAWWLFFTCCVIFIITSLMTGKPDYKKVAEVSLDSPFGFITKGKITGIGDARILAGILILTMVVLYYIFR
jgi:SSS family solute:Na+ symporter